MSVQRQRWAAFLHVQTTDTGTIFIQPAPTAPKQLFLQTLHVVLSISGAGAVLVESSDAAVNFCHIPSGSPIGAKSTISLPFDGPGIPLPPGTGLRANISAAANRVQIFASGYAEGSN